MNIELKPTLLTFHFTQSIKYRFITEMFLQISFEIVFCVFSQLDILWTPDVFVFIMKWGHAHADLSLYV